MNGTQIADVIARHHLVWAEGEGTCACGWNDLTPLFGYHLLGLFMDVCEVEEAEEQPAVIHAQELTTETAIERESGEEPPPVAGPPPNNATARSLTTGSPRQGPRYDREAMFRVIRRTDTLTAAALELGLKGPTLLSRLDTLEGHGELPEDIKAKRPGVHPLRLRSIDALGRPEVAPGEWEPLCMTADDFSDWRRHNDRLAQASKDDRAERPCEDCPLSYSLEMRSQGKCNGTPGKAVSA